MKTTLWRLLPILLIVLVAGLVWQHQGQQGQETTRTLACPDLHRGCKADLDGRGIRISVQGTIRPLQPFQVRVEAPGAGKVEARFTMVDMDMGFNLYTLRADNEGVFQASITLPACYTGRRDWIMMLSVDGAQLAVPFVTEL